MSRHRSPDLDAADRAELHADLLGDAVTDALGAERLSEQQTTAVFRVVGPDMTSLVVKIIPADELPRALAVYERLGAQSGAVRLQQHGVRNGLGYLVLPYYPQTAADLIETGPIAPAEVGRLLRSAADALVQLHLAGLVHADIKPNNLLMAPSGQLVLSDLDQAADHGTIPQRVTVGFCPPEQLAGLALGFENDVYSFCATALSMLAGGTAWMADPSGWLAAPVAAAVPDEAKELIAAGLAVDPTARRVSPQQLVSALGANTVEPVLDHAVVEPPALAVPARQVLAPVPVNPNEPAVPVSPATAATAATSPVGGSDVLAAAHQVWGFVDLRAQTQERLALQLQPPAPEPEPEIDERSIWRHPAMISSIALAVALIVLAVVLMVL